MPDETFEQRQARIAKQIEEQKRQETFAAQQRQKEIELPKQKKIEAENNIKSDPRFQQMLQMATDPRLREVLYEYWKKFSYIYETVGWWIFKSEVKQDQPQIFNKCLEITPNYYITHERPVGHIMLRLKLGRYTQLDIRFVWREVGLHSQELQKNLTIEMIKFIGWEYGHEEVEPIFYSLNELLDFLVDRMVRNEVFESRKIADYI
jgi:hypothetical protein